ncbi:flagellin [Roseibacterium beibuensis]|uniref:Flagellin n=1 Tax=[Roseibacterium] beibuensis TaxID=1193142 RepID=A0ABP9LEJ7_9RHOB|nr:flagellin [Roseibacterium beibuensis]MCS6626562.1 flagellin [Roseibacterium beibuensis]
MSLTTLGDAAGYHLFRRDSAGLKADLQRLTTELSTGRVSDLGQATGGDFSALSDVMHRLRLTETFATGIAEAALAAQGRQTALERLSAEIEGLGPGLLAVSNSGAASELQLRLADAPDRFEMAVSSLNTRVAGQSLFSGDRPDQPALRPADDILDALRPIADAAPDAATLIAEIDAWFSDTGGGYDSFAWQGGGGDPPPVLLEEGQSVEAGVTAREDAIRTTLAGLALAALTAEGHGPADETSRRELTQAAAGRLELGETGLIQLRANLGTAEAQLDAARVRTEATRSSLELEQGRITAADPYSTASEIEELSQRLESLYLVTARLSRLSLSEYL